MQFVIDAYTHFSVSGRFLLSQSKKREDEDSILPLEGDVDGEGAGDGDRN